MTGREYAVGVISVPVQTLRLATYGAAAGATRWPPMTPWATATGMVSATSAATPRIPARTTPRTITRP